MGPSREQLMDIYYYMGLGRAVEKRLENLYKQGRIPGAIYLGWGQEACQIGSSYALEIGDIIAPTHRDMIAMLPRGMDVKRIIAQHLAKETGPTRGRGEDNYLGDLSKGILATVSMLPDFFPVVAGAAFAFKYKNERHIALAYCGEGAASRGDWHEALNLAATHVLPAIFFVSNNQFAYSTPIDMEMKIDNVADRASAYGIPGIVVDGNDVIEVYEVVKEAAARARSGQGPTLIEGKTMRMKGHAGHDPYDYVPQDLLEEWKKKDPIERFTKYLRERWRLSESEELEIATRIDEEIEAAVKFADDSPLPDPDQMTDSVYH